MANFDVFNGDADGICALHQLRLTFPLSSQLISGAKRDVQLLQRVQAQPGDEVTVLDISLDANIDALRNLLRLGVSVQYFDHHTADRRMHHVLMRGIIDTSSEVCTSALVDRHLGGEHRAWAVVAAFGDGIPRVAEQLAEPLRYSRQQLAQLRELGELVNYNAYGDGVADLFFHPIELYERIKPYTNPLHFIATDSEILPTLRRGRDEDTRLLQNAQPQFATPVGAIYVLADAPASRRIRGDFSHLLAQRDPEKAHAVLSPNGSDGYTVSVRAPLARNWGADRLCKQFSSGGGRAGAAGVNHLPTNKLHAFAAQFFAEFSLSADAPAGPLFRLDA